MRRRAKIVATLGPASAGEATLERLLRAGADVLRFNLSHGTPEEHRANLRRVRRLAAGLGLEVPVLLDLMGPRFRLGHLDEPRRLVRNERITLGDASEAVDLPVDDPGFLRHLRVGERVLIDNGLVELAVQSKRGRRVAARVVAGGVVSTRKGINLPDSQLPFSISPKDRAGLRLAVDEEADFLGASYVERGRDIEALRVAAREMGGEIPIVAKLERRAAVEHLHEIAAAADALMVARGDLGVEVPLDEVPVLQKRIVAVGRRLGKPVIVATQMLESMMERPRPTRAESSDVANAVFDGADALMLSGETAAGRHPVESVRTMARIVVEAERYRRELLRDGASPPPFDLPVGHGSPAAPEPNPPRRQDGDLEIADVVASAAVAASSKLGHSHIVAFSQGGFTAQRVSRYRPAAPATAFTTEPSVARRMQLLWGITPIRLRRGVRRAVELVELVEQELLRRRLLRRGDNVILLMGYPIAKKPLTNLMRIHRVPKR